MGLSCLWANIDKLQGARPWFAGGRSAPLLAGWLEGARPGLAGGARPAAGWLEAGAATVVDRQ